jgi:hypothetical protein
MKMAKPNPRECARLRHELKKRLTTWHSQKELNAILSSWDPVGYVLGLRRGRTITHVQPVLTSLCEVGMRL